MYYDENRFPGLTLVLQSDNYDYEWQIMSIFKEDATGYFYWIDESGCSCNGPLEDAVKADLTRGNKTELMKAVRSWLDDGWGSLKPKGADRISFLEEVSLLA